MSNTTTTVVRICQHCGAREDAAPAFCGEEGIHCVWIVGRRRGDPSARASRPTTPFQKLAWMQKHANSFSIEVNDHRGCYRTAAQALEDDIPQGIGEEFDRAEDRAEAIRRDHLVVIQCYPLTPVGFVRVADYDFERAIERTYEAVREPIEHAAARAAAKRSS